MSLTVPWRSLEVEVEGPASGGSGVGLGWGRTQLAGVWKCGIYMEYTYFIHFQCHFFIGK